MKKETKKSLLTILKNTIISVFFMSFMFFVYTSFSSAAEAIKSNWCSGEFADICFENPFGDPGDPQTLKDLILTILKLITYVMVPLIVLGYVYSGFLFLKGQGNPEELKKAKTVLVYTIIGTTIIFSSGLIYEFIDSTGDAILKDI